MSERRTVVERRPTIDTKKMAAKAGSHLGALPKAPTGIQGLDKLVATFDPAGLNAGSYVLKVAVTDPSGRRQTNSLPFQVIH